MWNNRAREPCKFWPQGKCKNGNNCKFAHNGPGGAANAGGGGFHGGNAGFRNNAQNNNRSSFGSFNNNFNNNPQRNMFSALDNHNSFNNNQNNGFGQNNFGYNKNFNSYSNKPHHNPKFGQTNNQDSNAAPTKDQYKAGVVQDMNVAPIWPFSSYGYTNGAPCCISADISPDELRWEAYCHMKKSGNLNEYNQMVQSLLSNMQMKKQQVMNNLDKVVESTDTMTTPGAFVPSQQQMNATANMFSTGGSNTLQPSMGLNASPGTAVFGSPSNPTFGSPSVSSFVQPTNLFGSPQANLFGQPSQPTTLFGQNNNSSTTTVDMESPDQTNPKPMPFLAPQQPTNTIFPSLMNPNSQMQPQQPQPLQPAQVATNSKIPPEALKEFLAPKFTFKNIPEIEPPPELCR